jgi:tRNA-splicing ligase RtcB
MSTIKTFGDVDARSLEQLERCMAAGDAELGVLCADHHPGYSQPIGGGIAYEGYVSPSGVGYDIGCGNKAAQTELTRADLDSLGGVERIMDEITRRISFGMGVQAAERVDHEVLDKIRAAEFAPQRTLARLAESQLGTVGSGNHYVNVMEDEGGRVWVGVHFGSRGFGHKTASGFLALAQGLPFDGKAHEGEMDSPPVLFEVGSELGEAYVEAMELAGEYAYAGRDVVVAKVLEILGTESVHEVHNHHNFAWREEHFGRTYWVVRKGCTPARPGQEGFVGGSMGDDSVILEGLASPDADASLHSTVHGAGRVMSRTQAAGRVRRRKRWACGRRDCDRVFDIDGISSTAGVPKKGVCPDHPTSRVRKVWVQEQVSPGKVDWPAVQASAGRGDRTGRRRSRRGAGGVQAPAGGSRRARRHDPREAHASPTRRRNGRPRRGRPLQGLRAARAALSR